MKFAFLSSYAHLALDPDSKHVSGGAELQVALLARELARRGHEAVILGGEMGQADGRELQGVRTRVAGPFHTGGLSDTLAALPKVRAVLREEAPDFVSVLGWTSWLYFLHFMKGRNRYQLVFICGLDTEVNGEFRRENPIRGALFERGMRAADHRFAMSELQRKLFRKQRLDCGFYRNLILPRTAPRAGPKEIDLLWIARCRPIKQPELFLDLAERIPEARCRMICPPEDGELFEKISARARGLTNLELIPGVPYHQIQDHYDSAKIFVNTSTFEGFPNSFIQSGQGETAILSLCIDSDQLLEKFGAGFCAEGSFEKLVRTAQQLLSDPEALRKTQSGAARFVESWHDNDRNVDRFLEGLEVKSQ